MVMEQVIKILEEQTTTEWLPVSLIEIDMTYNRSLSPTKVKAIKQHFNPLAAGVLIVNLRNDGQYFSMDGQHRLKAMKELDVEQVECKVARGLTMEQEAEIYIYCNTVRKNPEALDTFRANLVKKDPISIAINSVVEKCGLSIQFHPQGGNPSRLRPPSAIWAIDCLVEIYRRGQEELLEYLLTLAKRTWPGDGDAFKANTLLGLMVFHLKYKGRYTRDEFIAKISLNDLKVLYRRAQYHAENGGGSLRSTFARALQEAYDKGRRNRRLEAK